jgi:predicted nucleic acid-binding protein
VRFWDASAIVPFLVSEKETSQCVKALHSDREAMVWTMSKVEVFSALCRRLREGSLREVVFASAKERMNEFFDMAFEIISVPKVKDRALRLLQVHPLRAADAMQLASVLVATQEDPSKMPIMSFDNRLIQAARLEGFAVNPD